jgi:hypothetical protein
MEYLFEQNNGIKDENGGLETINNSEFLCLNLTQKSI